MPTYDAEPVRWDHKLVIGDTYAPGVIELFGEDEDGNEEPHDLTGATGEVELRELPGGAVVLTPTWALVGAGTAGSFQWTADPEDTESLTETRYAYAVRVTFSDASVRTVLHGFVDVVRTVLS